MEAEKRKSLPIIGQAQSSTNVIITHRKTKRKTKLHETFILASWYGSFFTAIFGMFSMRGAVTPLPAIGMIASVTWFTICTIVNTRGDE